MIKNILCIAADCIGSCINNIIEYSRIGGIIVSVLASSVMFSGFEARSGQTKDYEIGICCFSAKQTVINRKGKCWLALNKDNVC